jgi:hypothetical protein
MGGQLCTRRAGLQFPQGREAQKTMEAQMDLFPSDIRDQLPPLYSQENVKDPIVRLKFFTPDSSWTWYATEGSPQGDDFTFFGYVIGHEREWGYFRLSELSSAQGPWGLPIERDRHFTPRPFSQAVPSGHC